MSRPIDKLTLTPEQRAELQRRVCAATTTKRDCLRAQIVLLRAQGLKQRDVAKRLNASHACVSKWTGRFKRAGLDGLVDAPGRGRPSSVPRSKVEAIISTATRPPKGRNRWSTRTMAENLGVSHSTVHRVWKKSGIKPHRTKTFKVSKDPDFDKKFWDVIGLYMNPPDKAIVLCCDEKSQCQALERTQPQLPLGMGHIKTATHDYIRHGTLTLFAALNYLEGKLISRIEKRHTHVEWLRFLKQIDRETPKDMDVHVIADNYATHKHPAVRKWMERHPRFHAHFTPTGSSWMNLVERFFADITNDCIRDGSFTSVGELTQAILSYLAERNAKPKPYRWHKSGEEIMKKIVRAREALAKVDK
jgi:transposase